MDCIRKRINDRWDSLAINLKYAKCPSCNAWMNAKGHPWVEQLVNEAINLDKQIREKSLLRAKHEGLDLDERL